MLAGYDTWKTSAPEPVWGTCGRCQDSEEDHNERLELGGDAYNFCHDSLPTVRVLMELEELYIELTYEDELTDEQSDWMTLFEDAVMDLTENHVYEEWERD